MSELPKLRRTFPEIIAYEIPAPVYKKKGELHNGSASHLHCEGQCSIHCSPTMFLFECDYCKLKHFSNENKLPSLWTRGIRGNGWQNTFCQSCNLQYGITDLMNKVLRL